MIPPSLLSGTLAWYLAKEAYKKKLADEYDEDASYVEWAWPAVFGSGANVPGLEGEQDDQ